LVFGRTGRAHAGIACGIIVVRRFVGESHRQAEFVAASGSPKRPLDGPPISASSRKRNVRQSQSRVEAAVARAWPGSKWTKARAPGSGLATWAASISACGRRFPSWIRRTAWVAVRSTRSPGMSRGTAKLSVLGHATLARRRARVHPGGDERARTVFEPARVWQRSVCRTHSRRRRA
jgi:hypothetical protein